MDAALELGNTNSYNMIIMGALLEAMEYKIPMENVVKSLKKSLPERHHKLIPLNEQAIEKARLSFGNHPIFGRIKTTNGHKLNGFATMIFTKSTNRQWR